MYYRKAQNIVHDCYRIDPQYRVERCWRRATSLLFDRSYDENPRDTQHSWRSLVRIKTTLYGFLFAAACLKHEYE